MRDFHHVESPQRLEVIYKMLKDDFSGRLKSVVPRPATHQELAFIHKPDYIERVASTAGKSYVSLDPDTQTSPRSYEAAVLAAGGLFSLVDALLAGKIDNGFALTRPPGHHAEAHRAMGFCLFNNVALAAEYGRHRHGLEKVLIIDWDLHHGNGSQHSFWENNKVLYCSTHQYPYYPGTGAAGEVGGSKAQGYTVNVPLSSGYEDDDFVQIFERILLPIGRQFKPDLILISAGFDTYFLDPLGAMRVTPNGFARMTRILLGLAEEVCQGRLLLALEGGYHLEGLSLSTRAVLQELLGESTLSPQEQQPNSRPDLSVVQKVWSIQKNYWKRD
ncbi:MAG: histone deacetylase [Desulfobacca sp.]|nr:histone deacetylase [Desulfobacca sp.]